MERQTIYVPTPHGRLEAWVYLPTTGPGPFPVVVMGCGVGAVKAAGLPPFATAFCQAGYAAVAFDYMTFGGSDGSPRHLVNVAHEYRDFQAMIAWAKTQEKFDPARIVAWGTSFGGMHVTRLLAEDSSIAAGIAQCPCVDAQRAARLRPLFSTIKLSFWAVCDFLLSFVVSKPIYFQAAITPGSSRLALMSAPDVLAGWQLLHQNLKGKEEVDPYSNRIVARSILTFPLHRPALKASAIVAPYLIVVPSFDSVAPKAAAEQVARTAKKGQLHEVPGGHFDLYHGGVGYESNLKAQLAFLKSNVPV